LGVSFCSRIRYEEVERIANDLYFKYLGQKNQRKPEEKIPIKEKKRKNGDRQFQRFGTKLSFSNRLNYAPSFLESEWGDYSTEKFQVRGARRYSGRKKDVLKVNLEGNQGVKSWQFPEEKRRM